MARREALYSTFVDEACNRLADAFENNIQTPAQVVRFFALYNQIRIVCSDEVAQSLDKVVEVTFVTYRAPNITLRELFLDETRRNEGDAVTNFSTACRAELAKMKRGFI